MIIIKKNRPVYKALKDFSIGDYVETPFNDKAKVISIQKSPKDKVYKIMLSNGNFIKTGERHYNTISFRKENGKKVYDTVTTKYIYDNLDKYIFEMPTFETFNDIMSLDLDEVVRMLPNHEYEPADSIDPIHKRENDKVYIESIELSEDEEAWCLTLNDPLGLYMVDHGTITHNSTFTMLALLYVACCFALMRDPWKFFSMAQTSVFAFVLCAVTQTKASEIYREPIQQLIEGSDYWMWCRTHQDMLEEEKHLREADTIDYIPWSTAAKSAVFVTGNNLQWKQISSANSLLGVNILMGAMTEITFFKEAGAGWTDEKIFNFYSKLKERISNRFQNNYYARVILDSSPSVLDDPVQFYMTYTAKKNPENMIWTGSRWDLYPGEFPEYCEVENPGTIYEKGINKKNDYEHAFQLFKGGNGKPPQLCEDEAEASNFDPIDLIWCPIKQVTKKGTSNFKNKARENPIEFMKDWAGLPAGLPDRLFYRDDWVENCFDNDLRNNYGSIIALADEEPEHLIWNQIKNKFFYDSMGQWRFYYEPHVPRVVSVDQSKSKDCTCISMSHVERDKYKIDLETGRAMLDYITDFTIVLVPKGGHINLEAIKFFIHDLKRLGNINLRHVSFDGWQSDPARQYLKRAGIVVDYVSVDSNNDPYYTFYDMVTHSRWFCGKNIFVKNNMKSLHEIRRKRSGSVKIEHFEGELNYEWQEGTWLSCTAGINAKDTTDAIAANLWLLSNYNTEFIPSKTWDPEAKVNRTYESVSAKNDMLLKKLGYV